MVRPKGRRDNIALKTARLSDRTLTLLKKLQEYHKFKTLDDTIYYYLPSTNEPSAAAKPRLFHSAREI